MMADVASSSQRRRIRSLLSVVLVSRTRLARLAGISLSVSILVSEPAAAQWVREARVAVAHRGAATLDAPLHLWSEARHEIPLHPFVVAGAVVGGVLAVRSLRRANSGDDWVDPTAAVLYVGRGVAAGAVIGLAVGGLVRELVPQSDR